MNHSDDIIHINKIWWHHNRYTKTWHPWLVLYNYRWYNWLKNNWKWHGEVNLNTIVKPTFGCHEMNHKRWMILCSWNLPHGKKWISWMKSIIKWSNMSNGWNWPIHGKKMFVIDIYLCIWVKFIIYVPPSFPQTYLPTYKWNFTSSLLLFGHIVYKW
jgi:hypothetical protein